MSFLHTHTHTHTHTHISHSSGGWKPEIRVPVCWSGGESLLPGCRLQTSCYVLVRELDHKEGCVCAKSLQLCLTLCSPMQCSPPGSSVQEILQARTLEWVAISFSRGSSWPRDQTHLSLCLLHWRAEELMLSNCGTRKDSWKPLEQQGDQTGQS